MHCVVFACSPSIINEINFPDPMGDILSAQATTGAHITVEP